MAVEARGICYEREDKELVQWRVYQMVSRIELDIDSSVIVRVGQSTDISSMEGISDGEYN